MFNYSVFVWEFCCIRLVKDSCSLPTQITTTQIKWCNIHLIGFFPMRWAGEIYLIWLVYSTLCLPWISGFIYSCSSMWWVGPLYYLCWVFPSFEFESNVFASHTKTKFGDLGLRVSSSLETYEKYLISTMSCTQNFRGQFSSLWDKRMESFQYVAF